MSASRLNRKQTMAIGVVIILGIAVTILNIRTFGKGGQPSRRVQASIQDRSALPEDLAVLVRNAGKADGLGRYPAGRSGGQQPKLTRDPFLSHIETVVQAPPPAAPETQEELDLACSAILLGARQSVAMINGKTLAAGDSIAGLTVTAVNSRGVLLRDAAGETIFLNVGVPDSGSPALKMEFKMKTKDKIGMVMTERNLP